MHNQILKLYLVYSTILTLNSKLRPPFPSLVYHNRLPKCIPGFGSICFTTNKLSQNIGLRCRFVIEDDPVTDHNKIWICLYVNMKWSNTDTPLMQGPLEPYHQPWQWLQWRQPPGIPQHCLSPSPQWPLPCQPVGQVHQSVKHLIQILLVTLESQWNHPLHHLQLSLPNTLSHWLHHKHPLGAPPHRPLQVLQLTLLWIRP